MTRAKAEQSGLERCRHRRDAGRRRLGIGQSFAQILWGRRTRWDGGLLDFPATPIGALPISGDELSAPGMLELLKVGPPCLADQRPGRPIRSACWEAHGED
jgi:hypothetical protein